ncbi:MAG TPA: M43 family zinc metalloprotease, partial [Arachidicoccus soli]|nr:M43 family zinc metalloprotease [Arachidicoccus soli]
TKYDRWPRSRYLNVWLVDNMTKMGGTAGYAYHPEDVEGALSFADGVIIIDNYIGSIGTGSPYNSRALTHEIGHFLGLDHVWGPTNNPAEIGNCAKDDGIYDTPNCEGSVVDSCDLTRKTCDTLPDPVQNYMDYSYCTMMFTKDQVEFMRNVLRQQTAQRNNLWSADNLSKTVPDSVQYNPVADFYVKSGDPLAEDQNNPFACTGEPVTFMNASWALTDNNPTYSWTFQDGSPSTSTDANPSISFNSPGWKDVTLTVTDNGLTGTVTRQNYIYISGDWPTTSGVHHFNFDDHPDWWTIWNPQHSEYQWEVKSDAGKDGTAGIFLNMTSPYPNPIFNSPEYFFNQRREGAKVAFITQPMDFTYLTNATISFDRACATDATEPSAMTESLTIYYSINCGKKWTEVPLAELKGLNLVNNGTGWTSFYPNEITTWTNKSFNLPSIISGKNHVLFKFVYTGSTTSNNIAIDNINIDGTLSVDAPQLNDNIAVYPNPSKQSTGWNIKYDANEWSGAQVRLIDMSGRLVKSAVLPVGKTEWNLSVGNDVTPGVYILKIQNEKGITQRKLMLK